MCVRTFDWGKDAEGDADQRNHTFKEEEIDDTQHKVKVEGGVIRSHWTILLRLQNCKEGQDPGRGVVFGAKITAFVFLYELLFKKRDFTNIWWTSGRYALTNMSI